MRQPSRNTLRHVAIFKGLQAADRVRIESLCRFRNYQRGKMIIQARDATRDVFFLIAGRARVIMYSSAGKRVSFREINPGEMFGEFAAIDGGARSTGVELLAASRVATMRGADFRAALRRVPLLMEAVLVHEVGNARGLTTRVFEFSTLAVNNRIHAEILRLAKSGIVLGRQARIAPFPTHGEIASRISTHREAVTRQLNVLERKKLIARAGTSLVVTDLARLQRMVEEAGGA